LKFDEANKSSVYARMYPGSNKDQSICKDVGLNEPIRIEDIDLLWDQPEKRVGRSQDILNMI